jgi:VIT1/CCC1 family predicted Fe2+/Mn2+ transporter
MPTAPHVHKELHSGTFSNKLNLLRASVLGANDGIISIAALVVGVAGASVSSHTLLLTGVAGLLAGAFSMAVGEFVSVSSQRDTEQALLAKERYELEHEAELELEELTDIYQKKGLQRATAEKVARELTDHDAFAAHAHAELGIDPDNLTNPWGAGTASAISYALGGLIPLLTIIYPPAETRVLVTFIAVFIALIITAVISARVSGAPVFRTILRIVCGGILAMAVTFAAGRLFDVVVT